MAKKNFLSKIRITYNAPVTLSFAIIGAAILLLNGLLKGSLIPAIFTAPGNSNCNVPFNPSNFIDYLRIILHVFGHSDWNHFISNMAFILLLGPVIEERYGSGILTVMMTVTAFVTGVLNVCFSPTQLLGSSDIAFMLILLTSFTSISKSQIPLSFVFVLVLYIGREIISSGAKENISTLAHIAGGICGSLFAFLATPRPKATKSAPAKASAAKTVKERLAEIDAQSPRFAKNQNSSKKDDDTTLVGSIEL